MAKRKPPKPPGDYPVGYCKPPEATRFKKGQSGNPKGRPKGTVSLMEEAAQLLGEQVTVSINGKPKSHSRRRLILLRWINDAMNGQPRARTDLLPYLNARELTQAPPTAAGVAFEQELLAALAQRVKEGVAEDEGQAEESPHVD